MSAAVHLVRGPALSGKTRRMGERFRLIAAGNAEAALWLAPDFRTADALRDRFLSEAATGFSPRVLALQDFVDLIVGANDPTARPLPRVQQRLLVEETVRELQAAKLLPHFGLVLETRGFLEGVISLVSELDDCAIDPEELCESAVGDKHTQCARIYAHYRRHVDRLAVYDTGARIRRAKELLHEGKRRPFDGLTAVFVDGFAGFTSCQNAILSVLCPWVTELWIALPGEELGRRDEVFSRASAAALASRGRDPTEYCLPPADADRAGRPAGLGHLERQLFRPVREVERSTSADGLLILEAPGELGEARMVARSIKALLLDNIPAEDIVVTLRDAELSAELLEEVFGEYGVPVDIEGSRPLSSQGAVSFLLRAAALPEDDFAFAGVTALLRSTWLRPEWEETAGQSNLLQQAEVLLRLIDKPKGLQAYLKSLDYWADQAKANEDEEPVEASRRKRKEQLATRCRPFLRRFFAAWEGAPGKAPLESHITWLQHLAEELGLSATAQEEAGNAKAWQRFWHELDAWQRLEARLHEEPISLDRFAFLHRLAVIAREAGVARTPRGPGRVRILSAPLARNLSVPRLFIMGLGEWGFPQVSAAEPFFEEVERQAYRASGLQLSTADERLADEMLLFYQLVTRPQQGLVLSYSAVDSNGQELLPSTFLTRSATALSRKR
jgi:ATP-dependent helicase/nuclease subunit B